MATVVERKRGRIVSVTHEPGNMTCYRVVACEVDKGRWLVAVPDWKVVLPAVYEGAEIHYGWINEKMGVRSEIDASEIAKAVAAAVSKCTAVGCTDERGCRVRQVG